jgi:hypothetical protein
MQLPPASVLATYPTPNYVNPETRGPGLIVTHSVLFPIASIIVGIRIYTRVRISKNIGLDDLFIILAMVSLSTSMEAKLLTHNQVVAAGFFCMSTYT